jgi:hypothetical protein
MAVSEVPTAAMIRTTKSEERGTDLRLLIQKQALALEYSCEKGAHRDTIIAARWHRWNLWLGLSSTVIAALAAFSRGQLQGLTITIGALGKLGKDIPIGGEIITFLALFSAILTSTLTFLAPSEKSGSYQHFSNKLRSLRDRIRAFAEIDCSRSGKDAVLVREIERMVREKSEIDSIHPIVPNWAYARANRDVWNKRQQKKSEEQKMRRAD